MKSIELKNVSKIYNYKVTAVDNVSFTLSEGEFVAVMGQSGSGKSTLLQMAGLLDNCTSGQILINGKDVSSLGKNELADTRMNSLGFVFQAFHLNPHLKVCHNIMVPMLINDHFKNRAEMKETAELLVQKVGLTHRIDHYPRELSGGEQQRAALLKILLIRPQILLLDEPTNHLDISAIAWLEDFLKNFNGACLIISHDRYFLDRVTNKTIELENKKIRSYKGNYSEFLVKKEAEQKAIEEKYENDMKEIERLEGIIAQQRQWNR